MTRTESGSLDVTQGPIARQLFMLAWPVLIQNLFQQLYILVDAFSVGQFAGQHALGGIQATTAICDVAFNLCFGICAGCAVIAGQAFGAHNKEQLSRTVHVGYALALLMGLIATFVGLVVIEPLLHALHTPPELLEQALAYGRLYFGSMVFWQFENMGAALLRAVGDSAAPSAIIALACVINAALDLLFVGVFKMEAFGAQLATTLSVICSAVLMTRRLMRAQGAWRLVLSRIHFEGRLAMQMLRTGIPLGLQMAAFPLSNTIVQSSINSFGASAVTAWGLTGRLSAIGWLLVDSIAVALTSFAAQNFGARNWKRMDRGMRMSLAAAELCVIVVALPLMLFMRQLSLAFINDATIANLCVLMARLTVPFYVLYTVSEILSGEIRGAGESVRPMLIMLGGTCLFRIFWVLVVAPHFNEISWTVLSYPSSYLVTASIFVVYWHKGSWLTKQRLQQ